jgi:hypothetical protein
VIPALALIGTGGIALQRKTTLTIKYADSTHI